MILWISKRIPKQKQYKPRDAIDIDINEEKVYGDDRINKDIDTAVDRSYRCKILAESLQRRYSSPRYPAWRRRDILNRIRSYLWKAKNVLEDRTRKPSLKIVRLAMRLQQAVGREDLTGLVEAFRKLSKNHRAKLTIMGYARLGRWIDWQGMKHGAPLAIVDPRGTSSECPLCDSKLEEGGHRILKCPRCGFEADREVIGKLSIRKRALKMLGISGEFWLPHYPPDDRCMIVRPETPVSAGGVEIERGRGQSVYSVANVWVILRRLAPQYPQYPL